jgi:hypothetical protein
MSSRAVIAVFAFMLAAMPARADDAGQGKIVLGFGAAPEMKFVSYAFFFRSADHRHRDYVSYDQNGLFTADRRDFDDATENGAVKILTMPAGDWEFIMLKEMDSAETTYDYGTNDISIPFTVKAGETVYIGDFKAVLQSPRTGSDYYPIPAKFIVGDRSARDIPIAQKKNKAIGAVTVAIPDVAALHSPLFEPERPSAASATAAKTP